jgi:hypothetical protein
MTSLRKILVFLLISIQGIVAAQSGFYPPPSSVVFHNDTLTIYPPDSLPGPPVLLLGYNIYVDSVFFDNILDINPEDTINFIFEIPGILPGTYEFCAMAFYNEWISDAACDTGQVIYGFELPFLEDWSSGSFETMQWTTNSDHWDINSNEGNPAPSLSFQGEPGLTNYEASLESYPMKALGMSIGKIWLDFDLKLEAIQSTGNEWLMVQVWNWSNEVWTTVAEYRNDEGSLTWSSEHINIRWPAINKVFRVRFFATGLNSADISSWSIDNIHIYRNCDSPSDLTIEENISYNQLYWFGVGGGCFDPWIHWDDGVNAGNSIGTGGTVEFDVAARWTPAQLSDYQGASVYKIAFFPAESYATYRARVWAGTGPDTLMADQLVISPIIGQWNYITLTTPVLVDITKELWVGYHIDTPTGYPAGVDDGPAINGYGNMMYYDSAWSTLLEINPELDYNWNIACLLDDEIPYYPPLYFNLYRETNQGGFQFYDFVVGEEYQDNDIVLSDFYCYQVTQVYFENGDTCESAPTNTACEYLMLGTGQQEKEKNIRLYPNPASNILNIESEEAIREVRIYNPLGEMVMKLEIGNLEGQIDVSRLKNGIYFVEVVTERRNYKSKVLVIRQS